MFNLFYPVSDSLEFIEREYVLVPANFASMVSLSSSLEPSYDDSTTRIPSYRLKIIEKGYQGTIQQEEHAVYSMHGDDTTENRVPALLSQAQASTASEELQVAQSLHPSSRIWLLRQYINSLVELAQEKV